MLAQFFIAFLAVATLGPMEIENGREAIQEKGVKVSIEQVVKKADASSLTGNYGNK